MIECTVSRKLIKTQFDDSRTIFEKKKNHWITYK